MTAQLRRKPRARRRSVTDFAEAMVGACDAAREARATHGDGFALEALMADVRLLALDLDGGPR